jgi:transcriptional regulator with XRE-family HTH domain
VSQVSSETELGLLLKARRKALGLTQVETATAVGKSGNWLTQVESGKISPRISDLHMLLRELNLSLRINDKNGKPKQKESVGKSPRTGTATARRR